MSPREIASCNFNLSVAAHLLLLLGSPAIFWEFTILGEIFVYVFNPTIEVVTFRLREWSVLGDRLIGLVVKTSTSRVGDPGFDSRLRHDFSGVESHQ